jgi:hypothetical protein
VQQLSGGSAAQLLEAAMVSERYSCLWLLCNSRPAQRLESIMVLHLFWRAAAIKCDLCMRALCWLPAAERLDELAVISLIQAAVESKQYNCLVGPEGGAGLLSLSAAQRMSTSTFQALLHTAMQAGAEDTEEPPYQLPVQHSCELEQEEEQLAAAAEHSDEERAPHHAGWFELLATLPAAQHLSSAEVGQLLQAAVRQEEVGKATHCIDGLLQLPQAQQLSADVMISLLLSAMNGDRSGWRLALFKLQAAQQLSSEHVVQLMEAAVPQGTRRRAHWAVQQLWCLPAAQQISGSILPQLLQLK